MARRHRLLPDETIGRRKFGASIAANWMDESLAFRRYAQEKILDPGSWTAALGLSKAMHNYFVENRSGTIISTRGQHLSQLSLAAPHSGDVVQVLQVVS